MLITSLVCKQFLEMAHCCLASVVRNVDGVSGISLLDDGSLSDEEMNFFRELPVPVRINSLRDREERMLDLLEKYPNAKKYRRSSPFAYKLLDSIMLSDDPVIFVDCDILFIKKMKLKDLDPYKRFLLRQSSNGYSGDLRDLKKLRGGQVPGYCNAGFFRLHKSDYDLDFIEYFLGRNDLCKRFELVEQTIFAMLFGSEGTYQLDFDQFPCGIDKLMLNDNTIALHFMHTLKKLWTEYAHLSATEISAIPIAQPARNLTYLEMVKIKFKRALGA